MGSIKIESRSEAGQFEIPETGDLVCGRAPGSKLRLLDDGVSRVHAIFWKESQEDWIRDAGSTNGTLLNGLPLNDPTTLRDGDTIQVGGSILIYRCDPGEGRGGRPLFGLDRWADSTRIGSGGMGVVFRAEDKDLDRRVAIKRLRPQEGKLGVLLRQLHAREAVLARSVDHPNVVSVLEDGVIDGDPYLLLEWVDGGDLSRRLNRGKLPVVDQIELLRQAALGLAAAHHQGVVHADLKPGNLLMTGETRQETDNLSILELTGEIDEAEVDEGLQAEVAARWKMGVEDLLENPPFVGREGELAVIEDAIERARSGARQWILICGERGVGRHRLCQQAMENYSEEEPALVLGPELELPPEDFSGVWLTPLPPLPPDENHWQVAMRDAASAEGLTEVHIRGFHRGPAVRLVERIIGDRTAAREFLEEIGGDGHPGRLLGEISSGLGKGAWLNEGFGCRFIASKHRDDPRQEAADFMARFDEEASGFRELLGALAPVDGTLGFESFTRVTGHDRAALWYIFEHAMEAGYLRRDSAGRYHFTSELASRSIAARLPEEKREKILRKTHEEIKNVPMESGISSGFLLRCGRIERGASQSKNAYRCFLAAALRARQEYRKDLFLVAVDEARSMQKLLASANPGLTRAFSQVEKEILGSGARGRSALERLRSLPTGVRLKIADFGIARRSGSVPGEDGLPWGTPRYMSPEQGRKEPLTPASDIFSLGVVAREMFDGRHPLGTRKGKEAIAAIVSGEVLSASEEQGVNSPFEALIDKMLDSAAPNRPTAREVAETLQRLQTDR